MPDDPNRNLDEQLSAWARKRRDEAGAPFELHPATRKLLQDEVARTIPKMSKEPAAESAVWSNLIWTRFAFAGVLCVALVAVVGLLIPGLAKSKSKGQRIALVRQQENDLSADSAQRDLPAPIAPESSRALEAPVRHLADKTGKSSVAESQPPAAPSLSESKSSAPQVKMKAEVKDVRLNAGQPAPADERLLSENSRELTLTDKAREPLPTGIAAPARESYSEKESNQAFLRQRYGVAPAQAGGVTSDTNAFARQLEAPAVSAAPSVAAPQVALDGATAGQRAGSLGGRGFADGTASNTPTGAKLAYNRPQNRAKADDPALALTWQARQDTSGIVSLATQREIDRLGTSDLFYAAIPPGSSTQRYTQMREYRVNLNSPPMPNVLNSFQLVQTGRQIRVVDADGSVYDGAIEQGPREAAARRGIALQTAATELKKSLEPEARRIESASAVTAGEVVASQSVFFRVAGTNRTLNQLVVFEGNYLANSNQTNEIVVGAKLTANQPAAAAARQSLPQKAQQTSSGVIRGQATIGPSSQIEINAAPVSE